MREDVSGHVSEPRAAAQVGCMFVLLVPLRLFVLACSRKSQQPKARSTEQLQLPPPPPPPLTAEIRTSSSSPAAAAFFERFCTRESSFSPSSSDRRRPRLPEERLPPLMGGGGRRFLPLPPCGGRGTASSDYTQVVIGVPGVCSCRGSRAGWRGPTNERQLAGTRASPRLPCPRPLGSART